MFFNDHIKNVIREMGVKLKGVEEGLLVCGQQSDGCSRMVPTIGLCDFSKPGQTVIVLQANEPYSLAWHSRHSQLGFLFLNSYFISPYFLSYKLFFVLLFIKSAVIFHAWAFVETTLRF